MTVNVFDCQYDLGTKGQCRIYMCNKYLTVWLVTLPLIKSTSYYLFDGVVFGTIIIFGV